MTEAGPELNAEIAEKVMGWTRGTRSTFSGPVPCWLDKQQQVHRLDWNPSTDIAAAWEVLDKMRDMLPGGEVMVFWKDECWNCTDQIAEAAEPGDLWEQADTASLAICLAALRAVNHG